MAKKKQNKASQINRKKKSHKALKYSLTTLAIILGSGVGFGAYEYYHLTSLTPPVVATAQGKTVSLPNQGVFNVLLLGSDGRPNSQDSSLAA